MDQIWQALLDKGLPFAMLAVAVVYFTNQVKDLKAELKEERDEKDGLQKELRDTIVRFSDKAHETITNNTLALNAFKGALFSKND